MDKKFKKAISVFLVCVLAVGMLPAAFASEDMKTEIQPSVDQAELERYEMDVSVNEEQNTFEEAAETPNIVEQPVEDWSQAEESEKQGDAEVQEDQEDKREKAIITIDLSKLTQEEWQDSDYITYNEEIERPVIVVEELFKIISELLHEGKTKEWDALEEIQIADTPNDGSGHLFTKSFAEDAKPSVEDKYRALEAFVADQGKITLYKEFKEGQILYQDEEAIMLLVLKCDLSSDDAQQQSDEETENGIIEAGVVVTSEAGSFIADVPVKAGTALNSVAVLVDEGTEQILKQPVMDVLEIGQEEIYMKTYQVILADAEGNKPDGNAVITLNTAIKLPQNSESEDESSVTQVKEIKVVQVNDDASLTVLDAEAEQDGSYITSVKFNASAFNYFAICYSVEYLTLKAENEDEKEAEQDRGIEEEPANELEDESANLEEPANELEDESKNLSEEPTEIMGETVGMLSVEGVKIEVVDGGVPEDTEVVFLQLDSFTAKQLAQAATERLKK